MLQQWHGNFHDHGRYLYSALSVLRCGMETRPLDPNEPTELARAIQEMDLSYVVITSVDRDDLKDSGARHFADCITQTKLQNPHIKVGCWCRISEGEWTLRSISCSPPPDVFNHNLETVPRLYRKAGRALIINGRWNC